MMAGQGSGRRPRAASSCHARWQPRKSRIPRVRDLRIWGFWGEKIGAFAQFFLIFPIHLLLIADAHSIQRIDCLLCTFSLNSAKLGKT